MRVKCFSRTCSAPATVKAEFQSGSMALYCATCANSFTTIHRCPMPEPELVERVIHMWPLLAAPEWIEENCPQIPVGGFCDNSFHYQAGGYVRYARCPRNPSDLHW